jgi:Mg2+-importing ATPase
MFRISNIFPVRSAGQPAKNKIARSGEDELRLVHLCAVSKQKALEALGSTLKGLSAEEADRRLGEYGANELVHAKQLGFWGDILRRCKSPLVVQLLVIAAIAGGIGEAKSAVIVGAMVVLSVGLSYILDRRSSRAVDTLGKRVQSRALVLRDGEETEIRISDVVPGDIVLLQAGSIVPADMRLLVAKDFFLSQSSLTGESMPVEKTAHAGEAQGQSALELANACYLGSSVTSGSAQGVVVNTGTRILFGSIFKSLGEEREKTSFDIGVRSFTWLMIRFMLVMTCAVFFIVGMTKGNWAEALLFALSIAVGLTPEMLPMIVTVNLAKGALAMAAKKVIIKRLPSIQNFGAIDILCTDETGTLTQDQVVLERYVDITGRMSEDVLSYAYLNSHYQTGLRNLIDRAILDHSDLNVDWCRLVDELPFDFQRRRMSVVVDYEGDHVLICKGAVEEVYDCCSHYTIGEEVFPLFEMIRDNLFEEVDSLNRDGFRVLAIAYREFSREKTSFRCRHQACGAGPGPATR